ncbi:MAG: FAD-dependent oxidoreductase [Chloroflexi bacterium]|nr:FAD-dependent oxidoreductase [Chloroflexota bacterium]MDA8186546.1 FAD-dependent oxidoreductase [Dehalococcoidales bacterium]
MSTKGDRLVIIGNGSAAISAVRAIGEVGAAARVTVVSRESLPCYSPTALHYLLTGQTGDDELWLRDNSFYADHNVELASGRQVVALNVRHSTITLDDGCELPFDKLLIASGASPLIPPVPGLRGPGVFVLRSLADARQLREQAVRGRRAFVLGAGLIGLQVAHAFSEMGLHVTVVEREGQVLPLNLDAKAAEVVKRCYEEHDVTVILDRTLCELARNADDGRLIARLSDGEAVPADLVVVAAGVKPNVDFLTGSGVNVRLGILVDERMQTNIPGIYAAGDVAEAPDFFSRQPSYNAILPAAVEQGDVAGTNMAGGAKTYTGNIPMSILRYWDQWAISLGSASGPTVCEKQWPGNRCYRRLVFEENRLVGGVFVNTAIDPGIIISLIQNRVELDEQEVESLRQAPIHFSRGMMLRQEGYLR